MKIKEINGRYYVQDGKVWRRVSIEEAIDMLLEEMRKLDDARMYELHGNGD